MNKRGVTVLFFLTLLTAVVALYQDTRLDARLSQEHSSALTAERELGSIDVALASLRAVQSTYVPGTQTLEAAFGRATELLDTMESTLQARQKTAANPELAARYDAALQGLAELRNTDIRARAAARQGDGPGAGHIIVTESAQSAEKLSAEIARERALEQQLSAANTSSISMLRIAVTALAFLLLVAVSAAMARALALILAKRSASTAQMIKDLPPPVKTGPLSIGQVQAAVAAATPSAGSAVVTATPTPAPTPASGTPTQVVAAAAAIKPATLAATAELCGDLARLLDGRDVPHLLARASAVLDAKGIMIWAPDAASEELRPSLAHGYSEKVLRKLQPLAIADENITSQTFRTMKPQWINNNHGGESMAIAVPLISSEGCVGVMAAEIRHNRSQADVMALARIIAAQFASIIGPAVADESLSKAAEA